MAANGLSLETASLLALSQSTRPVTAPKQTRSSMPFSLLRLLHLCCPGTLGDWDIVPLDCWGNEGGSLCKLLGEENMFILGTQK